MGPAPCNAYGRVVVVAMLVTTVTATFLETYQLQLTDLHTRMATEIGRQFQRNSALNAELIEHRLLPVVAEGTVGIRNANRELVERVAILRSNGTDSECWQTVDTLVYLYTLFAQWDLQDCVYGGYSRWMRDDVRERFYPRAHELHRDSSEVVRTTLLVLSQENVIVDAEDVESRLDATLDHLNELWIGGLQDLEEELASDTDRQEAIGAFVRQCVDLTIETSRGDVDYTIRYAEFHCL